MIYLLRHGQDDETYIGGWSKVGLTVLGIEQTKAVATFIKNKNFNIRYLYSSDIKRASTTASIIAQELNVELKHTHLLREQDKGLLTGIKVEEAQMKYPRYFEKIDIYTKYPNGEAMIDLYNRIKELLFYLLTLDNALLVTHRGVINMFYFLLNNRFVDMDKEQFEVTHASLHEMDLANCKIKRLR